MKKIVYNYIVDVEFSYKEYDGGVIEYDLSHKEINKIEMDRFSTKKLLEHAKEFSKNYIPPFVGEDLKIKSFRIVHVQKLTEEIIKLPDELKNVIKIK